jgi:hypothetical protein
MPQLDLDGANSKISADTIRGQSGTTVTVQSGHNLVGSGSGLTALPAANLTGTLPAISGASLTGITSLVASTTVTGSAVTSISFTGLDLDTHLSYIIEVESKCGASGGLFSIYANNLQTATDYYSQLHNGLATTAGAEAANNARIGYLYASGLLNKTTIDVSYATGRYFMALSRMLRQTTSTTFHKESSGVFKTAELVANLTRIDLTTGASNGFAVGTKARIYRRM